MKANKALKFSLGSLPNLGEIGKMNKLFNLDTSMHSTDQDYMGNLIPYVALYNVNGPKGQLSHTKMLVFVFNTDYVLKRMVFAHYSSGVRVTTNELPPPSNEYGEEQETIPKVPSRVPPIPEELIGHHYDDPSEKGKYHYPVSFKFVSKGKNEFESDIIAAWV